MQSTRQISIGISSKPFIAWVGVIGLVLCMLFSALLWLSFNQAVQSRNATAELYARVVEGAVTRTLESVEASTLSVVDDLMGNDLPLIRKARVESRIAQVLRFAPHIRQIVVVRNGKTWLDSARRGGGELDLDQVGFDLSPHNQFSSGLKLGKPVKGRFLPQVGQSEPKGKRSLIPLGIDYPNPESGEHFVVVVALNPAYLTQYFTELNLASGDDLYLVNFDNEPLITQGDFEDDRVHLSPMVERLVAKGFDETAMPVDEEGVFDSYIAVRLSEKYPLAIAVDMHHTNTFRLWREEHTALFTGLAIAGSMILVAGLMLVLLYRKSLAMRERLHLLSAAVQQSSVAVMITDEARRIQYVNGAFSELFGYSADEVLDKPAGDLRSAPHDQELEQQISQRLRGGQSWQGESANRNKAGELIPIEITAFPVAHLQDDRRHFICLLNDIRQRKDNEAHIRLLSRVVEHSPTIVLITNPEGDIEYVNPMFEQVTGYREEEVVGRNPRFLKSGETSQPEYEKLWATIAAGGVWVGELHNRRKDGSMYWERANIGSIKNEQGQITHYVAIKEIITQLKDDERRLRLASAVFNTAVEAIMVTDADNRIQMVNPSFTAITGYSEMDVLGLRPSILKSGVHNEQFYEDIWTSLARVGSWEGEIWNRRRNGDHYPQWLTISTMHDGHGNVEGYVSLFNDITQRKKAEDVIRRQANYDTLTGLPNRNLFADRLKQALAGSDRDHRQGALLFIDLDRFKMVNDTLGHSAGDKLLQEASERLKHCLRKGDTAARLGGDEFAVIIPDMVEPLQVKNVAQKILDKLSEPYLIDGHEAFVSGSVGITIYPDDGHDPEVLARNADSAMYKSKEQGRNTYQFFTAEMNDAARRKRELENALHQALREEEFTLLYQPIWNILTQSIESVEVLIRWHSSKHGVVSPADFISLAEEAGLITRIGEWVLREACRFGAALAQYCENPPKMSVNVSSRQIQRVDVAELVQSVLQESGMRGDKLVIEITESILIADESSTHSQLAALRNLGVGIAIDDFGTGYSSLSYLKRYPITRLKIDKSFVQDVAKDAEDRALISGIISMAQALSLSVIAEGVETRDQVELIAAMGCHAMQGYYFDKPMDGALLVERLLKQSATGNPRGAELAALAVGLDSDTE